MEYFSRRNKCIAYTGFVLMLLAIAGFLVLIVIKEGYLISETRNETSEMEHSQILEGNHSYLIRIGASDSTIGEDAVVRATFTIYIDGIEIHSDSLYSRDYVDNSNEPDADSDGDAIDSKEYSVTPSTDVNLTIVGEMTSGDYWYIKVYQDIPPNIEPSFIMTGITILVSLILMGVGVYLEGKTKTQELSRIEAQRTETFSED